MKEPKRIGLTLFDDEVKTLINASAKIFPMSEYDIENNLNPNNYEYAKVGRSIYVWHEDKWDYVIADDIDITWEDVKFKPSSYPPTLHVHPNDHDHSNKSVLDTITQALINAWNSAVEHILDAVKHITGEERTLWNTVSNKAEKNHDHDLKYSLLEHTHDYAPSTHNHDESYAKVVHNHDGAYYKKSEVDTKLVDKSDSNHTHSQLHSHSNKSVLDKVIETEGHTSYDLSNIKYIEDIRNGYTEGHSHNNFSILQSITQLMIDTWNTVTNKSDIGHTHNYAPSSHDHNSSYYLKTDVDTMLSTKSGTGHTHTDKADKTYVDTELAKKADSTTVSGHTGSTTIHVTQTDKNIWNGKANVSDIPTSLPANGGNADTVNGFTVEKSVPSNAVFTDTVYTEISTAEIDAGTSSTRRTISGRRAKYIIDKIPTKLSQLEIDMAVGGGITVGTTKPTDGTMWYKII